MALAEKTKIKVNIVGFIVLSVVLIYSMATQVLAVLQDTYSVNAIFPDAGGVFTNQEVTYRGVTVGQVGEMKVVEEGVSIELLIRETVKVPSENTQARVMFKSAVGEQFVDLLPSSDGAPYLEDGSTIPLSQTLIPVSTQELLATVEGVLRGVPPEALKGAVDALGLGLTGRGSDIATILRSTAKLATLFAERAPEIQGILNQGTTVGAEFLETRREFAAAIRDLVSVSASLSGSTDDLEGLLKGMNLTSDEVTALIEQYRPVIEQVVRELADVNALQVKHADDVSRLLLELPNGLNAVTSTFEPDTGMIRFGLVQDNERPACSYGTDRRKPEDRGERDVPKDASCDESGSPDTPTSPVGPQSDLGSQEQRSPLEIALVDGFAGGYVDRGPVLPRRMADWSWTLFYLNVM